MVFVLQGQVGGWGLEVYVLVEGSIGCWGLNV